MKQNFEDYDRRIVDATEALEMMVQKTREEMKKHVEERLELIDRITVENMERSFVGIPYKSIGGSDMPFFKLETK